MKRIMSLLLLTGCVSSASFKVGDCIYPKDQPVAAGGECYITAYEKGNVMCNLPLYLSFLGSRSQIGTQSVFLPKSWLKEHPVVKVACSDKVNYLMGEEE